MTVLIKFFNVLYNTRDIFVKISFYILSRAIAYIFTKDLPFKMNANIPNYSLRMLRYFAILLKTKDLNESADSLGSSSAHNFKPKFQIPRSLKIDVREVRVFHGRRSARIGTSRRNSKRANRLLWCAFKHAGAKGAWSANSK